jgi:hypothetical protein
MNSEQEFSGSVPNLSQNPQKKTPAGWYKHWDAELRAADKRTKKWRKEGSKIQARYQDRRTDYSVSDTTTNMRRVNLFHANIKTLREMLYGAIPKIDVSRSNADADDDQARVASNIYQRLLTKQIMSSGDDTKSVLGYCLENRLLPGLGIARVRYEFDSFKEDVPEIKGWDEDGNEVTLAEGYEDEILEGERAPIDYVHWDDFRWGWARTWSEVPWIAFRTYMRKDEAEKRFGKEIAKHLSYKNKSIANVSEKKLSADETADAWDRAEVWEIWDKERRCTFWWSKEPQKILDKKADLLELEGFWPCPEPMLANCTTAMLLPQPDFKLAQDLYNDIDDLQSRINVITDALRVVGVYDESAEGVKRIFTEGTENDLIPVKNWARLKEGGGLDGSIEWVPIVEIANVLDKLVQQRGDAMQLLYEVTGMAEIMRGGNGPDRETAEVGSKKAQFASVRVQGLQEDFARFASDLMKLRAEVISKHFSAETILNDSNIARTPDAELAGQAIELIKDWEETSWRIEIQPESMARIDYSSRQKDRTEFIGALGTFMSQAMPLVELEPASAPLLMRILQWTMAGFRGSKEIEGVLDQAIDAMQKGGQDKQEQPSDEQIKAQAQKEKFAHEEKMQTMKHEHTLKEVAQKAQADIVELREELKTQLQAIQAETIAAIKQERAQADEAIRQDDEETENQIRIKRTKDANGEANVSAS